MSVPLCSTLMTQLIVRKRSMEILNRRFGKLKALSQSKGRARRERGEFEEKRNSTRRDLSVLSALSGYPQPKPGLALWKEGEE